MQKDVKGNMITRQERIGSFRELVLYDSVVIIVTQTSTGNQNNKKFIDELNDRMKVAEEESDILERSMEKQKRRKNRTTGPVGQDHKLYFMF